MTWTISVLAITLFAAVPGVSSQAPARTPLDPAVIEAVDPLYPGFVEILESDDEAGLVRLARRLSDHPSPESLAVLLWMLRHCPSWPVDGVLRLRQTISAVGKLPLAPVVDALRHASADHRLIAAALLGSHGNLVPDAEKPLLDQALIAALADRSDQVRDMAAAGLRGRESAEALAAVRDYLTHRAAMRPHVPKPQQPDAVSFPPDTIALLESLDADYRKTLTTLNEAAVRRLLGALQSSRNRAGIPVLIWLLANGDTHAYGGNVVYQLSQREHARRLPFGELAEMLRNAEPDRKVLIAELFGNVIASRTRTVPPTERDRIVTALIGALDIPHDALRTRAVETLGRTRATAAIRPIVRLLEEPDGDRYRMAAIRALSAIGGREALPTLERLAQSGRSHAVREQAVSAYITVAKPRDPAAQVRRLLWEQPDTVLEKRVLAEGKAALPAVWEALETGTADERRAAAALLGWFRDTESIPAILTALDAEPGALTREQLLFDLNMILLTEAPEVAPADRNALATLHLRWLYEQLATEPIDSDIRSIVLAQKAFAVHPDRLTAPFSVTLASTTIPKPPGERAREVSATAMLSPSPQAFLNSVRKAGCGVAFHAITAANGVARVATTLYLPNGRIGNQVWISLYRRDRDRWVPLAVPSHPVLHRMINEPSLMPTINRDYGPDHPLKILRLDLTMERVRVDLGTRDSLRSENRENPLGSGDLDASYARLLERYKRADAPSVKYTAEFESARLTRQPNLPLWIDALALSGTPFQEMAQRVLAEDVAPKFKAEGVQAAGAERSELVVAALEPDAVDPRLRPATLPSAENIQNVRRWSRFALVDVGFGSGPRGQSGYSMLFERRGNRWVFLCVVSSWIS